MDERAIRHLEPDFVPFSLVSRVGVRARHRPGDVDPEARLGLDAASGRHAWKSINLRDYCQPQSFMVRFWHVPKQGVVQESSRPMRARSFSEFLLLAWVVLRTLQEQRAWYAGGFALETKEPHAN